MAWIEPITDRNSSDVYYVKNLMRSILTFGWDNVGSEIRSQWLYNLKGALNASDLNRIEGNIEYITNRLLEIIPKFYPDFRDENWMVGENLTLEEINRIRDNILLLISVWYIKPDAPVINYSNNLYYNDINVLEENIAQLKFFIDEWERNIKPICGTFYCGQSDILG